MDNFKTRDAYLSGKNIVIGLSGGVDSVVLLHYLQRHYPDNLRAIYINHHLSAQSNIWGKFCSTLCEQLNINYTNVDICIEKLANIEENSRKKRYQALFNELQTDEILCTAHHQNDQAETLLLQLFRGSGVAGLGAMPKVKTLAKGVHYRPLLNISKADIVHYAKQHKLRWIEDDSNKNTDFRRNFLRLQVMPILQSVYKNLSQTLSRSAKHQAETLILTHDLARIDLESHLIIDDSGRINVTNLLKLNPHRIKNILRFHLHTLGFLAPSEANLVQMIDLLHAKVDAKPLVRWGCYELRRHQNTLYFIDTSAQKKTAFCSFYAALKDVPGFSIRYRTGGERVKLEGRTHSQSLKKILQTANIPPWERNELRMYYIDDQLRAMERIGKLSDI